MSDQTRSSRMIDAMRPPGNWTSAFLEVMMFMICEGCLRGLAHCCYCGCQIGLLMGFATVAHSTRPGTRKRSDHRLGSLPLESSLWLKNLRLLTPGALSLLLLSLSHVLRLSEQPWRHGLGSGRLLSNHPQSNHALRCSSRDRDITRILILCAPRTPTSPWSKPTWVCARGSTSHACVVLPISHDTREPSGTRP
ncbi:uncharacterized protein BJX67DRAFT_155377 [Aspergillus lucknowensis]|uniref:Uncharacterized protein n=1 Tax=Aspergillus lucknowensis TaxID=176173 RepID=A0ABR4LMN4_9EURO